MYACGRYNVYVITYWPVKGNAYKKRRRMTAPQNVREGVGSHSRKILRSFHMSRRERPFPQELFHREHERLLEFEDDTIEIHILSIADEDPSDRVSGAWLGLSEEAVPAEFVAGHSKH